MNNIKRNYQRENKIMREELSPSVDLDKFQHLEVISVVYLTLKLISVSSLSIGEGGSFIVVPFCLLNNVFTILHKI